jgi:hypothetical protein
LQQSIALPLAFCSDRQKSSEHEQNKQEFLEQTEGLREREKRTFLRNHARQVEEELAAAQGDGEDHSEEEKAD